MGKFVVKFHSEFFKDLDKLSKTEVEIFEKKKEKILENPLRLKHLAGGENCYREVITKNIRVVYFVKDETVWMLTIDKHDDAYARYVQRLYSLRQKHDL